MNYRHAFHSGNFADVLKHVTLCRVLMHLREKPTAFRVIDTHAGAGLYDLTGSEASRSGEWREGIARLYDAKIGQQAATLLAPYLEVVAAFNPGHALSRYPGSPVLAQTWLRPQDRLVACEVEPGAAAALARNLAGDGRCKSLRLDGWLALRAQVPPKERRGVVVIDPPFEQADEFATMSRAITAAYRKWASGIFMLWYPVKDRSGPDALAKDLHGAGIGKLLRVELSLGSRLPDSTRLTCCGLIVINPPWMLESELTVLLPALADALSAGVAGNFRLERLADEK